MTVTPSAPSSPLFVEAASLKRKRDEPAARTYEAFDLAFRDAILKGINSWNYGPIFKELFAQADQITPLAERDEAYSEMADYLRKTLGLENRDVRAVWHEAINASTQSKTTLYFVQSMLRGARAIYTQKPAYASAWIHHVVSYVQTNKCAPKDRSHQLKDIVAAGKEMQCIDTATKLRAQRMVRSLQAAQIPRFSILS